jgi:hypothetical protein
MPSAMTDLVEVDEPPVHERREVSPALEAIRGKG